MESFIEPIRYTTSLFALITAAAVIGALRGRTKDQGRPLVQRMLLPWAVCVAALGLFFTHVMRGLPAPALVPAVAAIGLGLGIAGLFSARMRELFDRLDDHQWRLLMLLRAVFGALLLASGGVGLMPPGFALPAGLGDLLAGGLALAAPGSLAAGGHRGFRLLIFGIGLLDFVNVMVLQVMVLLPWLVQTRSLGISLLLPWLAVPVLATLNLHGMRRVLAELFTPASLPDAPAAP